MAQPTNQTPVPVEERLGLRKGTLLRYPQKNHRAFFLYPTDVLGKTEKPGTGHFYTRNPRAVTLEPDELFLYVRREPGTTAWVVFLPRLEKNLVILNRSFWKIVEVVGHPEEDEPND